VLLETEEMEAMVIKETTKIRVTDSGSSIEAAIVRSTTHPTTAVFKKFLTEAGAQGKEGLVPVNRAVNENDSNGNVGGQ